MTTHHAYYVGPAGLEAGHVRQPGRWGSIIRTFGQTHTKFDREQLMEAVRAAHYPDKPSRLHSNFVCSSLADAVWYRNTYCRGETIYFVHLDGSLPLHHGQILAIPPFIGKTDVEAAHHYWAADLGVTPIDGPQIQPWEVLTLSPITIVAALTD